MRVVRLSLLVMVWGLVGCSAMPETPADSGISDSGSLIDAGVIDAGLTDAGLTDAGLTDAGLTDAGLTDAGLADAGVIDAGVIDAGLPDAGLLGTGRIEGVVTESMTGGLAISGATVEAAGRTALTSATGEFVLTQLPTGAPLQVKARGPQGAVYSTAQREVVAPAAGTAFITLELLRGCTATVSVATTPGIIAPRGCGHTDSRVSLELPQGGVVDSAGAPVSDVRVDLAVLPVALGGRAASDALRAFPGDMRALTTTGATTFLESRGAVEVRLSHPSTGAALQLATGHTAVVRFSASAASFDEPSVPAWFFDEVQGRWVEEGSMTLEADPVTGALMHRLVVSHFTMWNADQPAASTCITGRLIGSDAGVLPSTSVVTFGVDYIGQSHTVSASDGRFSVFAKRSSEAELATVARAGGTIVERRVRVRTNPDVSCVDVGDVMLDTARLLACAAGRVVDEAGLPLPGIDVTAFSKSSTSTTVSAANGTFCVPVPPQERFDLSLAGAVSGVPLRGYVGARLATPGSGTCGGAGCTALGDLIVKALSCINGRVLDGAGVVANARVMGLGPANAAASISSLSGEYCLPLQRDGEVDLSAVTFGPLRTANSPRRSAPSGPAACGSASCLTLDLVLNDAACVRGLATDATGTPMEGVVVRAVPVGGGRSIAVTTSATGAFCAPIAAGSTVQLEFTASRPGTRFFATRAATAPASPASCGASGCTDVGTVALTSVSFSGCVKGRLLDGSNVFRDRVDVLNGNRVAFLRPRDDGTYCVDLPVVPSISLVDPEDRGCARLRAIPVNLAALTPGTCADETACLDTGDLDFSAFCATS